MKDLTSSAYVGDSAWSYDSKRFAIMSGKLFDQLEKEKLNEALSNISPNSPVLEVGAGTGRFSLHLAKQGYQIHLIDLSRDMLQISKNKFNILSIGFFGCQCSSTHLPFRPQFFDFVFAIRVLNQLPSPEAALQTIREAIGVCRTGGYVLFEFVNLNSLSRLGNQTTFLSMKTIHQLVDLIDQVSIKNQKGILFFSQKVLEKIPSVFKQTHLRVDKLFCSLAPHYSTRCYVLLEKLG